MNIEVLISTMMQVDYSLLDRMNISSDAVVINQCNKNGREEFYHKNCHIIWIDSNQRGLSKSRNMALENATADICLLADDDLVFRDNYASVVIRKFEQLNGDIIRFMVNGIEEKFKNYPKKKQRIGYLKSLKISSVEIAFLRNKIENIRFDERIGAGTEFSMGEENAFLYQCLRKKLKIFFLPVVISDLHIGNSTWFKGFNEHYFISRGAAFTAMKTKFIHFFILQFAARKHKLYSSEMSIFRAIKYMEQGRKKYLSGEIV